MTLAVFAIAAVLLSFERICYVWAWRYPEPFRRFCGYPCISVFGSPVAVLQNLFYAFKTIQVLTFFGWCLFFGHGSLVPLGGSMFSFILGGVLIVTGQFLNVSVFCRLGEAGVFYGNRFGYDIPRCSQFPFSILKHPQYVGATLSIWGFFLMMRFPHNDWSALPSLETAYYILGSYFEQ
jgi:phosphatidyl-N-methylethanolamine N-methyltransferase